MADTAKELLERYSKLQDQFEAHRLSIEARRAEIRKPVKDDLLAFEAEIEPELSVMQHEINVCAEQVKQATLLEGKTANGGHYQAVWSKGRVAWVTDKLDGYAVAHPEIKAFRNVGNPSVSIKST